MNCILLVILNIIIKIIVWFSKCIQFAFIFDISTKNILKLEQRYANDTMHQKEYTKILYQSIKSVCNCYDFQKKLYIDQIITLNNDWGEKRSDGKLISRAHSEREVIK